MRKKPYRGSRSEIEIWRTVRHWYESHGFTQVFEDMRQIKSVNEPHSLYKKLLDFDDFIGVSVSRDKDKLIILTKKQAKELIEVMK